jgi:hypothetical protein
MHEMLKAVEGTPNRGYKSPMIARNPMWVRRIAQPPAFQDAEMQSDAMEEANSQQEQEGLVTNKEVKAAGNLFRKKIIDDWRKLEKSLPRHMNHLRRNGKEGKEKQEKKWVSPD